jgi:flagellar hook assembly protein FlgD
MKKILLSLILLVGVPVTVAAHDDHDHEPAVEAAPHGGILRNAAPYKSELVLEKDNVKIYVYDKDVKPVAKEKLKDTIKGQLAFPKDKKKREVVFKLDGDHYAAKIAGIEKVHRYDLHVTLEVEGKPILADFGVDNIH